jgi:hypothetical protein
MSCRDHYLKIQAYSLHRNFFYIWLYSISFFRTGKGVEIVNFTFERSIRTEVVTYRLDVAFGSLHTQQLHGIDELRNDQAITKNRSAEIDKMAASFYLPASF